MIGRGPDEVAFPRGVGQVVKTNAVPDEKVPIKKGNEEKRKIERDLFSSKSKPVVKEKKSKKKDKSKKQNKSTLEVRNVANLTYSQLSEGLVLLGYISQIQEFELKVSLPGHLVASLPITNISPAFTSRIRAATEAEEKGESAEALPSLSSIFKEGEVVAVAVVSVAKGENSRWAVTVSLAPNRVLGPRSFAVGDLVRAAVSSKEDHGYIMDVGSNTVRGFVTSKGMGKAVGSGEVGSVIWAVVTRAEAGVVTLNPTSSKVWAAETTSPSLHTMIPGTKVKVTVDQKLDNGIKVSMKGGLAGYVHKDQLEEVGQDIEEVESGGDLEARLLYIVPTVNTIFLTLRDVKSAKKLVEGLKPGQVVEGATVENSTANSVLLNLGNEKFGLVNHRQLSEGKEVLKNVKKKFPIGTKVTARVLGLDFCSGVAVCSLQKSLVSGIQHMEQLEIGQKVTATVKQFCKAGLVVSLGPTLTALIPSLFLSDVILSKPELKYLPGDKVKCRVLRLDPANNRLQLTSKPILVNNDFTIVSTWAEALPGAITEGVVVKVSGEGLLIQLWGQMKGWAPKSQLSLEKIDFPEKLFFLGQAVKCKVVDGDESKDRITLSLVLDTMKPLGRREKADQHLELGADVSGVVTRVTEKGADVEVIAKDGAKCRVLLPAAHLTDQVDLAPMLLQQLVVGKEVKGRVWHKDVVTLITMKPSLTSHWDSLPTSLDQYHVGTIVPGVVQRIKKFGVFLQVPGLSKFVLAPTRLLQDFFLDSAEGVIEPGQTLFCKVVEVDKEQEKMTVTTSLKEVAGKEIDSGQVLLDWLGDSSRLQSSWLGELAIGQAVTCSVSQVSEFGALVDVAGVKGVVTKTNLGTEVAVGDTLQGVILHVDHMARCIEVSCQARLVGRVIARRGAAINFDASAADTKVRGEVVLVKSIHNLAVVSLMAPKQFCGLLGLMSTRRHLNDLVGSELEAGHEVAVVVKQVTARGEVVVAAEKETKKANKRSRTDSVTDSSKRARKESETVVPPEDPAIAPETMLAALSKPEKLSNSEETEKDAAVPSELNSGEKQMTKKRKKGKEESAETSIKEETVIEEEVALKKKKGKKVVKENPEVKPDVKQTEAPSSLSKVVEHTASPDNSKPATPGIIDPGWDYTATSISRPAWRTVAIWSDDEEEEEKEEKKHKSKAEAKRLKRVEEEEAARREQRLLDGEVEAPQTEEEFERAVVASPDSSLVWVQFMACCMQAGELEKARAVAKRALQRINFRLDEERLNIFLAWLNLENTFGSEEAMAAVLKEALQCCDQYKVYTQLAAIYGQSGKASEAEKTFKVMVRKFGKEKEVWIKFAIFYFKLNKLNDGRFLLQRSKQSLDEREHVEIATKFAQIEFRYGDPERGKTLFETILSNFPRRTDLWSVYVDQLVKTGDTDAARALYRRIATLDLQARKMKFLFKKWLDFETAHGSDGGVSEVKSAAQRYLESRGGSADPEPS